MSILAGFLKIAAVTVLVIIGMFEFFGMAYLFSLETKLMIILGAGTVMGLVSIAEGFWKTS